MVGEPLAARAGAGQVVVYARVSSADQRAGLDRQVARVTAWATGQGLAVSWVVTELGPAVNGGLREFLALLRDEPVTAIAAEHRGAVRPVRCRVRGGGTVGPGAQTAGGGSVGGG